MSKVFHLTIVPASAGQKELFILAVAPGVPVAMRAEQWAALEYLAEKRGSEAIMLKDCDVFVVPRPWWRRTLDRWLSGKQELELQEVEE